MNKGEQFELEFCESINGKHFADLGQKQKDVILMLKSDIHEEDIIYADKIYGYLKPDVRIQIEDNIYNLSLKLGISNTFHTEKFRTFMDFLSDMVISEESLDFFRKFIFLDSHEMKGGLYDFMYSHRKELHRINRELNKRQIMIEMFLRFVVQGVDPNAVKVNYLLLGNMDSFRMISARNLFFLFEKQIVDNHSLIHCGPFYFQPQSRNRKRLEETGREQCVMVKWHRFHELEF